MTAAEGEPPCDLRHFDGVLANGRVIRDRYLADGWGSRAWTWHQAADITIFNPVLDRARAGDVVWIGNWAGERRAAELREFLVGPVGSLRLRACVHGVRYPKSAVAALANAGIAYEGWLPNFMVPRVFARFALTVHIPGLAHPPALPGRPAIRPFEAMACGIPMISAGWEDVDGLFTPGEDFRVAHNQAEMRAHLAELLHRPDLARAMARRARRTILSRHTCAHRVDELLAIYSEIAGSHSRMAVVA
jgi:spore maturation protein CgeB